MRELVCCTVGSLLIMGSVYLFSNATAGIANRGYFRRFTALLSLAVLMTLSAGCSAATTAQDFANVITGILNIAKAEIPALPPADGAIVAQWTTLGTTLDGQLQACIAAATTAGGKKATFLACFNAFATGIAGPTELAQLRILSSASQTKVQLWVTAIILGVNAALTAFGGTPTATPQVAAQPPSHRDVLAIARRIRPGSPSGL